MSVPGNGWWHYRSLLMASGAALLAALVYWLWKGASTGLAWLGAVAVLVMLAIGLVFIVCLFIGRSLQELS